MDPPYWGLVTYFPDLVWGTTLNEATWIRIRQDKLYKMRRYDRLGDFARIKTSLGRLVSWLGLSSEN